MSSLILGEEEDKSSDIVCALTRLTQDLHKTYTRHVLQLIRVDGLIEFV